MRRANVTNNTFRLMKSIYRPMKHVEICSPENQRSYWMFFRVNNFLSHRHLPPISLNVLLNSNRRILSRLGSHHPQLESRLELPAWVQGKWFSIGTNNINGQTVHINRTQLTMRTNGDQRLIYDLKFLRLVSNKRRQEHVLRLEAKSLEQW